MLTRSSSEPSRAADMAVQTAEPHERSLFAWACAIESYAAEAAAMLPPMPREVALSVFHPEWACDPTTQAFAREAGRRDAETSQFYRKWALIRLQTAGASAEWLASEAGNDFVVAEADLMRVAFANLQEGRSMSKPMAGAQPDRWRPSREIVIDVIAGAFALSSGGRAEAAKMLNRGIPAGDPILDTAGVRHAFSRFRRTRMLPLSPGTMAHNDVLLRDVAMRFGAAKLLWDKFQKQLGRAPQSKYRELVASGQLLDERDAARSACEDRYPEQIQARVDSTVRKILQLEIKRLRTVAGRKRADEHGLAHAK